MTRYQQDSVLRLIEQPAYF